MKHADFVEKYNSNQIAVDVHRNKAGFMYEKPGLMPQQFRVKQAMIRTLAFGGVFLGIALFFFVSWWVALGVMLIAFFMFPLVTKSAAKGVILAALQEPHVYQVAIENQVLFVKEQS